MDVNNNVGHQGTIKFNVGLRVRKPKRKNEAGAIFNFYLFYLFIYLFI